MSTNHLPETPPDCFSLAEVEAFEQRAGHALADVNYFIWQGGAAGGRFLYFLELLFEDAPPLLLTCGEDSSAIRLGTAEELVGTAQSLRELHDGQASIQRANAGEAALWANLLGKTLGNIRLSRHENGLYRNDALLLDFGEGEIFLRLGIREGLFLEEKK